MEKDGELHIGSRVGEIEITGLLGEGGMGRVYAGFDRRLERKLALKQIRGERRLAPEARARFLREARMLSRLRDPHICQIHDLLETPSGDILVLELIEGRSLREAMDEGLGTTEALSIAEQLLGLLVVVHRAGVIHRDLKPENIMLQGDGRIKVLDFGLARGETDGPEAPISAPEELEMQQEDEETAAWISPARANLTRQGVVMGTLRYMSPEQARGEVVGPPSDIYSVGLIIQEMLCRESPFDADLSMETLLKKVGWGDIRRPDSLPMPLRDFLLRLTSLPAAERPSARDAINQLRRILDQPKRRRRRSLVLATLLVMSFLAVGMSVQWFRAKREAERARRSLAETREVSSFLERLFRLSDPFVAGDASLKSEGNGKTVSVESLLERGTEEVRNRFAEQPLAQARFMLVLGRIQRNLSHLKAADELVAEAVELRRRHLPRNDPAYGEALAELGETRRREAKYDDAEGMLNEALKILSLRGKAEEVPRADTLNSLGLLESDRGDRKKALVWLRRALEIQERLGESPALALSLQRIASNVMALGHYEEAENDFGQALEIIDRTLGFDHPAKIALLNQMGSLEKARGNRDAAEADFSRALEICRGKLPPDHLVRATLLTNLANLLDEQERYPEAEPLYREALEIKEKSLGRDHPESAQVALNLAILEQHLEHFEESEQLFKRAISTLEKSSGPKHPTTGLALMNFGVMQQERGRFQEAEKLYRRALGIFRAAIGSSHPLCAITLSNLGEVLRLEGRLQASEKSFRQALKIGRSVFPEDSPELKELKRTMAVTLAQTRAQ